MEFKTVSSCVMKHFDAEVNKAIKEGFKPLAKLSTCAIDGMVCYSIAMVKEA